MSPVRLEPGPLAPESSTVTLKPPRLPHKALIYMYVFTSVSMSSCAVCSCKQNNVFPPYCAYKRTMSPYEGACPISSRRFSPAPPPPSSPTVCDVRHPKWVQCTRYFISVAMLLPSLSNSVFYCNFSLLSNYKYPTKWLRDKCHMDLNESNFSFLGEAFSIKTKVIKLANHKGNRQSSESIKTPSIYR